jgi:hypothetical protein
MIYKGWKDIDTDDFTCDEGHYSLRVEKMSNKHWWWGVYLNNEELASDILTGLHASTEMEAKLMAQIAQMQHQHEADLRTAVEMARIKSTVIYTFPQLNDEQSKNLTVDLIWHKKPDEIIEKILKK